MGDYIHADLIDGTISDTIEARPVVLKVCPECKGKSQHGKWWMLCPTCRGTGILLEYEAEKREGAE